MRDAWIGQRVQIQTVTHEYVGTYDGTDHTCLPPEHRLKKAQRIEEQNLDQGTSEVIELGEIDITATHVVAAWLAGAMRYERR